MVSQWLVGLGKTKHGIGPRGRELLGCRGFRLSPGGWLSCLAWATTSREGRSDLESEQTAHPFYALLPCERHVVRLSHGVFQAWTKALGDVTMV